MLKKFIPYERHSGKLLPPFPIVKFGVSNMHQKLQTNKHGSVKRYYLKFAIYIFGVFQEMLQLLMISILVYTFAK
jgi:hypothetical protein